MAPCPWEGNCAALSFDTAAPDGPLLVSTCSSTVSAASWHLHASALARTGVECADKQSRVLPAFEECHVPTLRRSSRASLKGDATSDNGRLGFAALSADRSAGPADGDVASLMTVDTASETAAHHDRSRARPEHLKPSKRFHAELSADAGDVRAQLAASDEAVSSTAYAADAASEGDRMSAPSAGLSHDRNSDTSAATRLRRWVGRHSTGAPGNSSRDGGVDGRDAFVPGAAVKPLYSPLAAAEAAGNMDETQQGTSSKRAAPKDEQKKRHRKSKSKQKASSNKRMSLEGGDADMLPAPAAASAAGGRPNTSVPGIFLGDLFINSSSR